MKLFKQLTLLFTFCTSLSAQLDTNASRFYLFTYFQDSLQEKGASLAFTTDGIYFTLYNDGNPLFKPTAGRNNHFTRDPMIYFDAKEKIFHSVWTTDWRGKDFGYASSKDLLNWSSQQTIKLGDQISKCEMMWAPEIFYDDIQNKFQINWATNKRMWYSMTSDFKTFSKPEKLYDPGYEVIDGSMIKEGGKYYMFFNDCRGASRDTTYRRIQYVTANNPQGKPAWSKVSKDITRWGCEGPSVIKMGDEFRLYFDPYNQSQDQKYHMVKSLVLDDVTSPWEPGPTLKQITKYKTEKPVIKDFRYAHGNMIEIPREYVMHVLYDRPFPMITKAKKPSLYISSAKLDFSIINIYDPIGRLIPKSQFPIGNDNSRTSGLYILRNNKLVRSVVKNVVTK